MNTTKWIAFFAAVFIFIASLIFLALFMRQDIPGEEPYHVIKTTVDFHIDNVKNTSGKRSYLEGWIDHCGAKIFITESAYYKDFDLIKGRVIRSNVEIYYYYKNNGCDIRVVITDLDYHIKER